MSRCMLALLMLAISASATAEIRSFSLFSIDVPTEWICDIEERPTPSGLLLQGELISIYRPYGIGVLKMSTYDVPYPVSQDRLRMLTNVPRSTVLEWQERGDFSGYQYSYVENQSFFKQWWLSNEGTILLITYESSDNEPQVEIGTIEEMLNSIKINRI